MLLIYKTATGVNYSVIHKVLCAALKTEVFSFLVHKTSHLKLSFLAYPITSTDKSSPVMEEIKKTLLELIDLLKEKLIPELSKKHGYILQLSLSAFALKLDELPYKRCNKVQCMYCIVCLYPNHVH